MSPGMHQLNSSVNWDSDSQRKFWNAGIRSTCKPSARKPGAGAMRFSASSPSLILNDRGFLEIGCGNGWLNERHLAFYPVTGVNIADEAIQEARRRVSSAEFHSGNIPGDGPAPQFL
jgi:SAM-dependent methyltransferase